MKTHGEFLHKRRSAVSYDHTEYSEVPLLTNVVSKDRLTSSLTTGQFIKAVSSFLGPVIAAYTGSRFDRHHATTARIEMMHSFLKGL